MLSKSNIDDLKNILKNNVLSTKEECYCYAQDSTHIKSNITIPDAVVFVESTEDVQRVLKYANEHKIPVIARGAGTNMVGACTCNNGGIVLNFSKMNKILKFSPDDMTMTVQPGVVLDEIKKLAATKCLAYPPDPSNYKVSTIGGSIAQSSGGAKSFKYGTTKDYILSLKVVLADGTLMKLGVGTVKDAVGYHLNQLIIGSEGTLAIVVEAELKLIPKPNFSCVIVAYFNEYKDAVNAVNSILQSGIFPSTIDFMDRNAIVTVENFMHSGLNKECECMLLIEAEGFDDSIVHAQAQLINKILLSENAESVDIVNSIDKREKIWTARRASFAAAAQLAPDVISDDIIVPRSKIAEMIAFCREVCVKYNLKLCMAGHIGDGNIHPQIALNMENDQEFKNCMDAKSEMYKKAISLGGSVSSEHGIGIEKINFAEQMIDEAALKYMKQIKKLFDSNNILNPGKIFKI